jgi:FMN phosphatase YigB (HAD superfamily)
VGEGAVWGPSYTAGEGRAIFAIAFALGGTLTREEGLERQAFLELTRGLSADRPVPFDADAAERIADELFPVDRTEHDAQPRALVDAVSTLLGTSLPFAFTVARFRQLAGLRAAEAVRVAPETRVFLERVASLRVPAAILCEGWSTIAQRKAALTGLDCPVLVSEDIGAAKPSAAAFATLVAAMGLPPEHVWYVGCDPRRDVGGAALAGLRAIWLNTQGAAYPSDVPVPARTITALDELLPELCETYTRSLLGLRYVLHSTLAWRPGHFVPGVEYGLNDPATIPPIV